MKRRLQTLMLFAVLGVIINIALAWTFALLGSFGRTSPVHQLYARTLSPSIPADRFNWPIAMPSDWPPPVSGMWCETRGLRWDFASGAVQTAGPKRIYSMKVVRCGWPLYSMTWVDGIVSDGNNPQLQRIGQRWLAVPFWLEAVIESWTQSFPARRRLPIDPLWPGFALNTIMFEFGLWLLRARRAR